ncbi:DUF6807 domain-containing protein [Spelaeicoccus albus]|uniref:Methane monooxygenase PmoA-like n=1 Tax=Spelaeicoccus albus TaxID=1280376 RepID=A0A7Z0AAQ4_9MICO|nr:PmoA family protein [Spelaeicoccus albus]NYI66723.1 hypothetical protein [Spelaeicoccus albus]
MTPTTALAVRNDKESGKLDITCGDVRIAEYHYAPDSPAAEAPKPFFHPLRALDGTCATAFRPADHRWHKGLAMTWSEVSGENFWGGPTFDASAQKGGNNGYVWKDNIGSQQHDGFDRLDGDPAEIAIDERLSWITAAGAKWLTERRSIRVSGADADRGVWALDLDTELTNVSGSSLEFGSPTTLGRPAAGYTGLFWRGPRSWVGERFAAPDRSTLGDEAMGTTSDWLALAGESDEVDGTATVLMYAADSDRGPGSRWFARSTPIPAMAPSPAFDETFDLPAADTLRLRHRMLLISGRRDAAELSVIAEANRR